MALEVDTRSALPSAIHAAYGEAEIRGKQRWKTPTSDWTHETHPRAEEVSREVDDYFLQNWNFPDDRARSIFLKAGFSLVTCLYFPLAKNERLHFACRLLTVLFLIDDILEDLSFADGEKLNSRLMELSKGPKHATPDSAYPPFKFMIKHPSLHLTRRIVTQSLNSHLTGTIPAEFIIYDLWESMRHHDPELADEVLEPTFEFMRSQTDRARTTIKELGEYLQYREKDVGKALLSALMRYSMDLRPTTSELEALKPLEQNCSKHLSIVNDIYSYEKEVLAEKTGHAEGAFLCSAVKVLASETALGCVATKRVLWSMVREWELIHTNMCQDLIEAGYNSQNVRDYMRGLQCQMSGNEHWSRTTPRYLVPMQQVDWAEKAGAC